MTLKIKRSHLELITAFAEQAFPNECCGFLLGQAQEGDKTVLAVFPAANAGEAGEQYHRFLITPDAFLQCEKYAKEREMEIVGFYHSHPNAPPKPSAYDLEHGWPWYSYMIVSVVDNQAGETASWVLADDRSEFHEERIIVMNQVEENK